MQATEHIIMYCRPPESIQKQSRDIDIYAENRILDSSYYQHVSEYLLLLS